MKFSESSLHLTWNGLNAWHFTSCCWMNKIITIKWWRMQWETKGSIRTIDCEWQMELNKRLFCVYSSLPGKWCGIQNVFQHRFHPAIGQNCDNFEIEMNYCISVSCHSNFYGLKNFKWNDLRFKCNKKFQNGHFGEIQWRILTCFKWKTSGLKCEWLGEQQ